MPSGAVGPWKMPVEPKARRATQPEMKTVRATESVWEPNHGMRAMRRWTTMPATPNPAASHRTVGSLRLPSGVSISRPVASNPFLAE